MMSARLHHNRWILACIVLTQSHLAGGSLSADDHGVATQEAPMPEDAALDAEALDAETLDAGALDAGALDAAALDAAALDAAALDAGALDAAALDAEVLDAETPDEVTPDLALLKDLAGRIEAMLVETYPADEPGAAVVVTAGGAVIYHGAHGMASLELAVALEPEMVFRLGSLTKQFTAAAILLLVERGALSLGDPITDYLPDYPVHGYTITLEHLLTHTSGIFSYTSFPHDKLSRVRADLTTDELIGEFKSEEMEFAPGERWNYSNSGYVLLGAIIEKVSGQSYAEFVRDNILRPLSLRHTHYGGHQLIPRRVAGYRRVGQRYFNARYLSMTQPYAAGALLSNVGDLALWNAALNSDQLLSEASRQKMFTAHQLTGGELIGYGYGYFIGTLRGSPALYHGGSIFGFSSFAIRLPEEGIYVAVLQNGSPVNPSRIAREIAALAIDKPFPDWQRVDLAAETLERYAGVYRIEDGSTRTVVVEGGRLYTQRSGSQRIEAFAHSENGFFYPDSLTHFEVGMDEQGEVAFILMFHDGADEPEKAMRVEEPAAEGETGGT